MRHLAMIQWYDESQTRGEIDGGLDSWGASLVCTLHNVAGSTMHRERKPEEKTFCRDDM